MARQSTKRTVRVARKLRREMTLPEVLLWQALKQSDVKFRKQHPCGPFVVDFYCPAAKLAIEVDGIVHDVCIRPERDDARDNWLKLRGYSVLRIAAQDVLMDVGEVADAIVAASRERMD